MNRFVRRRGDRGFTLIELLVVIVIILMVLALAIPVVSAFMKNKGLSNAGSIVRAGATKARARAIATRDVQFLLIYVGTPPSDTAIGYNLRSVTDPSLATVQFTSGRGTMIVVDENARTGAANTASWRQTVDEPMVLPEHSEFVRGGGGSPLGGANGVIEVQFYADGSLILNGAQDRDGSWLRKVESDYDPLVTGKDTSDWGGKFDCVIRNKPWTSVCMLDFVSNTGTIDQLVYPK